MQGSCQHWCTPFFWTPLREIDLQRCNPSVAVLFSRDAYQQRRGMQTVRRVGSGVDDSQSVELRDRAGMATTVLTRQQFWLAPSGLAVMLRRQNRTLRRMGRAVAKPITVPASN